MEDFWIQEGVLTRYTGPGGMVRVPEGVHKIGIKAFWQNTALTEVILPEGLRHIAAAAFEGCENLQRVTLPSTLQYLEIYAFNRCGALTELCHPHAEDGILYDAHRTAVIFCIQSKTGHVVLPETVTDILNRAFYGCSHITGITLPASLRAIHYDAFGYCTGLKELEISMDAGIAWSGCLKGCRGMEKLILRPGVRGFQMRFLQDTQVRCIINESGKPILTWKHAEDDYVSRVDEGYLPGEALGSAPKAYRAAAAACYLSSRERYDADEQFLYDIFISRQAGKLLTAFVEGDCVGSIHRLLATGKVKPAALKKAIAAAAGKPEITALLLQWQHDHVDLAAERAKEERKQLRALSGEEPV